MTKNANAKEIDDSVFRLVAIVSQSRRAAMRWQYLHTLSLAKAQSFGYF